MPQVKRPVRLGVLVCLLVLAWQSLSVHSNYGGNWTALFYTGELSPIPPQLAPGTWIFPNVRGYDGQMYRYIARDPLIEGQFSQFVDDARMRYRRILLPGAAALFGRRSDAALIGLVAAFVGLGVFWTAQLFAHHGCNPLWGLLFLLMPATLASIQRTLVDGPFLALFAAYLLYVQTRRWGRVFVVCTLAVLTRETGLLLIAGAVIHLLLERHWKWAAAMAASSVPAAAWAVFVWSRTQPSTALEILDWPLIGIVQRLFEVRAVPDAITYWMLRITDPIAVAGLLAAIALGAAAIPHLQTTALRVTTVLFALLAAILTSPVHLQDPIGFARPVTPLVMVLAVEGVVRRSPLWLFPAASMSLAVGIYYISPAWGVLRAALRAWGGL